eukprot:SAG31_NODE_29607_length_392_cov_1.337884_1_plen_40_part_10
MILDFGSDTTKAGLSVGDWDTVSEATFSFFVFVQLFEKYG